MSFSFTLPPGLKGSIQPDVNRPPITVYLQAYDQDGVQIEIAPNKAWPVLIPPGSPVAPTLLMQDTVIPSYMYQQFNDVQYFLNTRTAFNNYMQRRLTHICTLLIPDYTRTDMTTAELTYVAQFLYGQPRFQSAYVTVSGWKGVLNGDAVDMNPIAEVTLQRTYSQANFDDDQFRRVLTWNTYRGDGRNFTVTWLKRRVWRYMIGTNGYAYSFGSTPDVSVTIKGKSVTISVRTEDTQSLLALRAALSAGNLNVPIGYDFTVENASK